MNTTSSVRLPDASYYMALWGIEAQYGGMTTAVLARVRAFREIAGVEPQILTYHYEEDLDQVRTALVERGVLAAETRVRNLWEDLRDLDDQALARAVDLEQFVKSSDGFSPLPRQAGGDLYRERRLAGDEVIQQDYYRLDGTLFLSRVDREWPDGLVRMYLCDRAGRPIGYWPYVRSLYRFWLDTLPRDPRAVIIVDSKTSARHYADYHRDDVAVIYQVHGSHLSSARDASPFDLSVERRESFSRLNDYDGIVFLTGRQRDEVAEHLAPDTPLLVCPNVVDSPVVTDVERDELKGLAMGRLLKHKRFGTAIEATARASSWRVKPKLDIVGTGERQPVLEKMVKRLRLHKRVRFAGYVEDSERWFAQSSYVILTSKREGFGLVLVEAMAQGCLPIAYDIRYGPSDIITDGVDGFLVPEGDKAAITAAIKRVIRMPRDQRVAMRTAARRRAQDFDAEAHVRRWVDIVDQVWKAKALRGR